jgi:hypothetical protein
MRKDIANPTKILSLRVPETLDRAVKLAAREDDRPVSAFLRRTLAAKFTPSKTRPDDAV